MLQYFLLVLQQVAILFIMMMVGVVLAKVKKLNDEGVRQLTTILLTVVTVSVIVKAFASVEFSLEAVEKMGCTAIGLAVVSVVGALLGWVSFRSMPRAEGCVAEFGTIFSNCGFMAIPVADALFGDEGVFIVSIYLALFQITAWTYGVYVYTKKGEKEKFNPKNIFLNSGVIGVGIGLIIFLLKIELPTVIMQPMSSMAAMNSPLAMIVTGYYLVDLRFRFTKGDSQIILGSLLRLLAIPAVGVGVMYLCGIRGITLAATAVPMCAPAASYTVIFAEKYGADRTYAARFLSICTLLSLVTMPVIISLAMKLSEQL